MMALPVTVKTIPIRLTAAIITFISITTGETTRPILPMMPINSRAPGTGGQPLKPVGNNTASLYATAPCIEISLNDDIGTDKVAQQAENFLKSGLSFHAGNGEGKTPSM